MGKGRAKTARKEKEREHAANAIATGLPATEPMPAYSRDVRILVTPAIIKDKSLFEAYLLLFVFGLLGAHHFYLRRYGFFLAYFFTFGLCGVGYLVDIFRLPCLVKEANRRSQDPTRVDHKTKFDAYLLWFPFGILGFHHFYLRNFGLGFLYLLTFGVCGLGWLIDLFRIPSMVRNFNAMPDDVKNKKSLCDAYIFSVSPLGFIGAHHYYLNRIEWGILYTFTLGLMGVGYLVDWFRLPILVKRANQRCSTEATAENRKYLDDAYLLWFPLGMLGFHHFYLQRYGWGVLYFFTFGVLGIGWILDFFRLPCLVSEFNRGQKETQVICSNLASQGSAGSVYSVGGNGYTQVTVSSVPQAPGTISYQATGLYPAPQVNPAFTSPQYPPQQQQYPNQQSQYPYQQYPEYQQGQQPPPYTPNVASPGAEPSVSNTNDSLPKKS